ncbi:cysteine desulfurase CsdA [Longibacter salinarum]|uniref:Probable cysteine desulfurase n=1 Tax=Longibacter salinarum TaxID=1850348 RepID=A0A2A8CZF5_9BACT|nr:cysteine desulfurase [Longibacter salinarum]PEN13957.1 cysteine desulfurase CsdA [Longibacter salinarum]
MPTTASKTRTFDVEQVRRDFPALHQDVYDDTPLVYLDNAATSQKPQVVIDRLSTYYEQENSNVHRGVHRLSQNATDAYEDAREAIRDYINAPTDEQVIFTRGTTESINLVANTFGKRLKAGDEVVITEMEHHANIVPWQMLRNDIGIELRVVPISDEGVLNLDALRNALTEKTKLVSVVHISNALGTINPVKEIVDLAHERDIPVLVDGAQSVPHGPVDVQDIGADFFCFSGHKMCGPTGIGVLYGRHDMLTSLPPYHGGGDMIDEVSFEKTTYADLPHKLEAGTPNIADAIGLASAARYISDLDTDGMTRHEHDLLDYATEQVSMIPGLSIVGTAPEKASVVSMAFDDLHPYDVGTILDRLGVAVRTGHHCTQPLMKRLGLPGTLRASFAFYNTRDDVDALAEALDTAATMLR